MSDDVLIPSGIRDNYNRGAVGEFLREKIHEGSKVSIVSAYFTIYAYDQLKDKLLDIDNLRFLFGEPRFVSSLDPEKTDSKSFNIEDRGLQLTNRLEQKKISRDCSEWIRQKAEIRSIKQSNLLHGKMYHIDNEKSVEAILGSSNFTVSGLGLGDYNNIELNLEVDSKRDLDDLKQWFEEIWQNDDLVEDVKADVLRYLEKLYADNSPEFIYFKTLYHIFEKYLEEQEAELVLDRQELIIDTQIWDYLFEFQKDGVKAAINKILNYNGCIIADSVGLGKTFEALAVIKYFEIRNHNVLVLCPKKLRENWTVYQASVNSVLNPFPQDRFNYTVLNHTDLSRDGGMSGDVDLAKLNWGNYDLVVIDESHNFRNNNKGKRDEEGNRIRKSRYERLMEDIIQGSVKTKVLLLSATPVNNDLRDLRNQIYFLTEGSDTAYRNSLGIRNIENLLRIAQSKFNEWVENNQDRDTRDLLEKLDSAFFKLLDGLKIARSRKHIERYYQDEIDEMGGFPERLKPIPIYSDIDLEDKFISYDHLNEKISGYNLSLFNPSAYVKDECISKYELDDMPQFSQRDRESFLIGMMKVGFLKRLESSIHSFRETMQRTLEKIEQIIEKINDYKEYQQVTAQIDNDDLEINELELEDEEVRDAFQVGKKLVFDLEDLYVDAWLKDLKEDHANIEAIHTLTKDITPDRDAKLAKLKNLIKDKVNNPTELTWVHPDTNERITKKNKKVLVFTAFADTARYLYENLVDWATKELNVNVAMVTGGTYNNETTLGDQKFEYILTNFSPISKKRYRLQEQGLGEDDEIDLLIATDCISEGQNLQDCDYMINYDIHWNPVRIIQRFGRIDRIGSWNDSIQLVNFWPTKDLEKYISLKYRVEARMALVDLTATGDDNLLDMDAIEDELSFRDKQLLRLKDEILDLEDFNETVTLSEFTLDDFRIELTRYLEGNRKELDDAPLGLYAVVPRDPQHKGIRPGVIFCLRQKGEVDSTKVNPLQPYFLIYVLEDDTVRYTFAHPKQILEIMRSLCAGKKAPYEELCELFDEETSNGEDMGAYNDYLETAVKSIRSTFIKRAASSLAGGRDAVLLPEDQQVRANTDFDLITWLVIKNE